MLGFLIACGQSGATGSSGDFTSLQLLSQILHAEEKPCDMATPTSEERVTQKSTAQCERGAAAPLGRGPPSHIVPALAPLSPLPLATATTVPAVAVHPLAAPTSMLDFMTTRCSRGDDELPLLRLLTTLLHGGAAPPCVVPSTEAVTVGENNNKGTNDIIDGNGARENSNMKNVCGVTNGTTPSYTVGAAFAAAFTSLTTHIKQGLEGPHREAVPLPHDRFGHVSNGERASSAPLTSRGAVVDGASSDDMEPPLVERTMASLHNVLASTATAPSTERRPHWSSSIPRPSSEVFHDAASPTLGGADRPPREMRSASATDSVPPNPRVSYASRYLERLHFSRPLIVRPASSRPPVPSSYNRGGTGEKAEFLRCYRDPSQLPHRYPPLHPWKVAQSGEERRGAGTPVASNLAGRFQQRRSSAGSCDGSSQLCTTPSHTSSLGYNGTSACGGGGIRTRSARAPHQMRQHEQKKQQEEQQQQHLLTNLVIEGKALEVPSRWAPTVLVKHLRRRGVYSG
ncbi:hypothetical protein DQ04_00261030 [Trypanosoma grayi]|uniref:hypothetical protein n=1 Tax=Trypanosoma grayi TaxID=71804 RepID=UPI0004F47238|nr:hypothetical protein DQ04_00261030 [Trypanosoma grayi]KEG14904.1 hypothetical protein DQ04_00261030 [Trypanosoma grayi]